MGSYPILAVTGQLTYVMRRSNHFNLTHLVNINLQYFGSISFKKIVNKQNGECSNYGNICVVFTQH